MRHERMSISGEYNSTVEASTSHGWSSAVELCPGPNGRVENGSVQNLPYKAGYTSSGSDQFPSSSNYDAQDRTRQIIFKLFVKDPNDFPGALRTQIFNWLSHSPSEMESYIRPGFVVLSVYLSMPSTAWFQGSEFSRKTFYSESIHYCKFKILISGGVEGFWFWWTGSWYHIKMERKMVVLEWPLYNFDRDWCALVKTLLDILVVKNSGKDGLSRECMEELSEINLLNRAVKRKCRDMVELLVHYSLMSSNGSLNMKRMLCDHLNMKRLTNLMFVINIGSRVFFCSFLDYDTHL
ncbi:hypothetical protein NE237_014636 [Protea cynaroides]|uniref:Uncharacterized protein n=1 Tax=Protea cynaroides TaxID=273540 RepID=A0A9Q0QQA8_9MAGN|nr:hypothetical protein NE237_014636 [Protea cynaroides]